MNNCSFVGRLVADPETKTVSMGDKEKLVCTFRIAVNVPGTKDKADFFNVQTWDNNAKFAGAYLKKGNGVGVVGSMRSNRYTDKDGNNRDYYYIDASRVEFTPFNKDGVEEGSGYSYGNFGSKESNASASKSELEKLEQVKIDDNDLPF